MSAVETQLRSEGSSPDTRLQTLIESSDLDSSLKNELNELRRYRNHWVHISDPWADDDLLNDPSGSEEELFEKAKHAIELMMKVLFKNQWV